VSRSTVLAVIEAANIKVYEGENDNKPGNGVLWLRSDIHALFDLNLLGIAEARTIPTGSVEKRMIALSAVRVTSSVIS
jgi:hypothetical protein